MISFMRLCPGFLAVLLLTACLGDSSSNGGSPLAIACASHNGEGLNREAIALSSSVSANNGNACQELHQYNLFAPNPDEDFPRGDPRRPLVVDGEYQGLPYVLNTALFSDYTAKHRIVFLPRDEHGDFIPATYRDADGSPDGEPETGDLTKVNDNLLFPVGTVIAKSFSYPDTSGTPSERIIETRLLIKHTNTSDGSERWEGVTYVWTRDEATEEWIARRNNFGSSFSEAREWHYPDPGNPALTIQGSVSAGVDSYDIPSRANCLTCHSNASQDAGAAPIGLKVRHLNRPYQSEFGEFTDDPHTLAGRNQLDYWHAQGWLEELPPGFDITNEIANVERIQPYNVPGDEANPDDDLTARARGYLDINCAHCHNQVRGSVEDFYMEFEREFCNPNFFAQGWINPGNPDNLLGSSATGGDAAALHARLTVKGNASSLAMPRLARQLVHEEGAEVIRQWIEEMETDICD